MFDDFDETDLVGLAFGVIGGFIALFVMKSVPLGVFWKIMTFVLSTVAGYVISKIILNK